MESLNQSLIDYFRCEDSIARFSLAAPLSADRGYFHFGPDTVCFGQVSLGSVAGELDEPLEDLAERLPTNGAVPILPFDPVQVVENLRRERYEPRLMPGRERLIAHELVHKAYYLVRNFLPRRLRRSMQRAYFSDWKQRPFPAWPVDFTVDTLLQRNLLLAMRAAGRSRVPFIWFWPCGAPSCLMLTHDVETAAGRDFTAELMALDESYGFKAAYQVIPEKRYDVSDGYVQQIRGRGNEFNIHDLNHDGRLYRKREAFLRRAEKINQYVRQYTARGFRAGSMYRIQDWYDAYEFSYDMSVPNVAHLEPKRGGCCTVFPYFVGKILELPLTTCQDYSVFHILSDYSLDLWKHQVSLIRNRNGLISVLAHQDYLISPRARVAYQEFLDYLRRRSDQEAWWTVLPGEVDRWWRARSQMKIVARGDRLEIIGPECERARLAYAVLDGDRLAFELAPPAPAMRAPTGSPFDSHRHDSAQRMEQ